MESPVHRFSELFRQLGLPDDERAIATFLETHRLPAGVALAQAEWWTPAQARFLHEAVCEDADWAQVVEQLDAALRR